MIRNNKKLMAKMLICTSLVGTTIITGLYNGPLMKAYAQDSVTSVSVSESRTDKIKNKLISELKNYNEDIYFDSSYEIKDSKDIQNLFYDVLYENPEIFWVSLSIANTSVKNGSTTLYVSNIYDNATIDIKRAELENKVKEITNKYKSYSELRQEYEIHDYIMDNVTYDYDVEGVEMPSSSLSTSDSNYLKDERKIAKENPEFFEGHSAYGALINGLCVCEGYSKAFVLLLKEYGIESGIVKNNIHGWNYVKINGKYYHVDLTYNDAKDEKTAYPYKYFNITTKQMSVDHDWTTNTPESTDTTFDNIFRKEAGSIIMGNTVVRVEDNIYTLEYVSGYNYNLCKMDLDGSNKEIVENAIYVQYLLQHDTDLYYTLCDSTKGTITIEKYDTTTGVTSTFLDLKKEFDFTSGTWATNSYILDDSIFVTFIANSSAAVQKEFSLNGGSIVTDLDKAVTAVVKAEGSKKQSDVNSAKNLVNALKDGNDKTSLLQRLQAVQASIDYTNSITNVINAVAKAETSKTQADVDNAKTLVSALKDGSDKDSLLQRLQVVQDEINNNKDMEQKLNDAIIAVEKAETSKLQTDVNSANVLVEALKDGSDKNTLLTRLQTVQNEINADKDMEQKIQDAMVLVSKAEASQSQADVNSAKTLVNELTSGSDKDSLLKRLQVVQDIIDSNKSNEEKLNDATNSVIKAESSKSQSDVNDAKTLVNALIDGTDKGALLQRLQAVQAEIDSNNVELEKEALAKATEAVIKAETSQLQSDINTAETLVKALKEGNDRDSLLTRLQAVQDIIDSNKSNEEKLNDAVNAVIKAEGSKTQTDVNNAKTLVEALTNESEKTSLLARLQNIQDLINSNNDNEEKLNDAIEAVIKAESSKSQVDINNAKTLVEGLTDSIDKETLLQRLQVVQDVINDNNEEALKISLEKAIEAVIKAENSQLQTDVNNAKTLVKALVDGNDKISLLARLETIQKVIDNKNNSEEIEKTSLEKATEAVIKAESSKLQADVDSAKTLVKALVDGNDKESLLKRLQVIQNSINSLNTVAIATNAVIKVESTKTKSDYETALALVNNLENSTEKTSLLNRLKIVKAAIDNNDKDNTNNNNDSNKEENIGEDNDSDYDDDEEDDDDDEDIDIEDTDEYEKAEHMLKVFKRNLDEAYYEYVKDAIDDVEDSDEKDELLEELKKYKKKMKEEYKNVATGETTETYYEPSNITTGWVKNGSGQWSFITPQGSKMKGFQAINGQVYCFDDNGFLMTGWYCDNLRGIWYYFNPNSLESPGALVTGWFKISGKWYYFNPDKYGAMEKDTTIDGYRLGSYGAMI